MYKKVRYSRLNSRQKESHNFHKVAARLADNGFNCVHLTDDWQGADAIAIHIDGETYLKIQLKGRCTIDRKYQGKNILIAFIRDGRVHLYDHDKFIHHIQETRPNTLASASWRDTGKYSWQTKSSGTPKWILEFIEQNRILE